VAAVARIPLPLQALALLGAFAVGYAIGLALVQLWGQLAGTPRAASNEASYVDTGVLSGSGVWRYAMKTTHVTRAVRCFNGADANSSTTWASIEGGVGSINDPVQNLRIETRSVTVQMICGSPEIRSGGKLYPSFLTYTPVRTGVTTTGFSTSHDAVHQQSNLRGTFTDTDTLLWVTLNGQTVWQPSPPETPQPIAPRFNETPEVAAAPQLLPVLPVLPIAPAAEPVPVPSEPATAPRPAPVRVAPRPVLPLPVPGARQTNNSQLAPLPQAAPATIPADVHFPWPGGPAVGPGGTRPDVVAVAQEVGRIEQKLALMPKPGPDPSNPVDWGDLAATLLRIWEAIQASNAAGLYTLSSPCELDENTEERIVTEIPYDGALTWLEVLNNKVDALAQLQQVAKDLKQPICRHKAQGQPVTVTFVEE
jgi:hypothetical protein